VTDVRTSADHVRSLLAASGAGVGVTTVHPDSDFEPAQPYPTVPSVRPLSHDREGVSKLVEPLRIGVLGAARISELSIVGPAATGTRLVAVAAPDRDRAEIFARQYGIERVHESYADVLADPDVEAICNPLANSLHAPWNKAAILAGKHVLTEKPFASNGAEAAEVRDLAHGRSLVVFDGFTTRTTRRCNV
jgi:hypothetical protein